MFWVKTADFISDRSWPVSYQKMVFKSRGQITTWLYADDVNYVILVASWIIQKSLKSRSSLHPKLCHYHPPLRPRGIPFINQFLSKLWICQWKVLIEEFTVVKLVAHLKAWIICKNARPFFQLEPKSFTASLDLTEINHKHQPMLFHFSTGKLSSDYKNVYSVYQIRYKQWCGRVL